MTNHLDGLNQALYNTEISFHWGNEVEDELVRTRKKAVEEAKKQGKRYAYDPEGRVYFLMLYGMYSSLFNKHMTDVGKFEIRMSDLLYAKYHLEQLREGYKMEIREFLPDDVQSILEAVKEVINEQWELTGKGVSQTTIYNSTKIPITSKTNKKSGKTKSDLLNKAYAELMKLQEIKVIALPPNGNNRSVILYFPFDISDEVIKGLYPESEPFYS